MSHPFTHCGLLSLSSSMTKIYSYLHMLADKKKIIHRFQGDHLLYSKNYTFVYFVSL